MSWDVLLTRLPYSVKSIQELPDDFQPPPLGSRNEVENAIAGIAPDVDLSDLAMGVLDGGTWVMELDLGVDDPVLSITVRISGKGDDVLDVVFSLASELRCRVLDCSAGDVITEQDAHGWHAFQEFRGRSLRPPR